METGRELVWACARYDAAAVLSHMTAGCNHDVILPFYLSPSEYPPSSCGGRSVSQWWRKVKGFYSHREGWRIGETEEHGVNLSVGNKNPAAATPRRNIPLRPCVRPSRQLSLRNLFCFTSSGVKFYPRDVRPNCQTLLVHFLNSLSNHSSGHETSKIMSSYESGS